ncbi:MAG: ethanolamine ammonia-lyase reactivating factor EutA [Candidatus Odinarchaeota archaeon]
MTANFRQDFLSVGIDIGTSTSHLIFSNIVIERDFSSKTEKYHITDRKILYRSPVYLTPLNNGLIDYQKLSSMLIDEYRKFGVSPADVDTGAIIITGESAKRSNAENIVHLLSKDVGKFVVATAGPNLESVLSAKGSGAVEKSRINNSIIMNIDIGGGTSNIAVIKSGRIVATACINVGGRLLATDGKNEVIRLEKPIKLVAESMGCNLETDGKIENFELIKKQLSEKLADCLMEAVRPELPLSPLSKQLMQTDPLAYHGPIDEVMITGGIGEYIYNNIDRDYGDLGKELANAILTRLTNWDVLLTTPTIDNPIRATVIGTGQYTLQVSGSTTFLSRDLSYPVQNLPVVPVTVDRANISIESVSRAVNHSLRLFDIEQDKNDFILSFRDPVRTVYGKLMLFAKGIEHALSARVKAKRTVFLVFDTDIGNSVGNVIKRETSIESILSIDEVVLEEGDFIDIGEPIFDQKAVPVHVKTLAFYRDA